jgi:hypothetical protein
VHTEVTYYAVRDCHRTNSMVSRSPIARTTPALPPGMQIKSRPRATLKRVRGYETEPAVAGHRSRRFSHDVHRGLGQARQHLLLAGEVELSQFREIDKADVEERHAWAPFVLKRDRNSVGEAAIMRDMRRLRIQVSLRGKSGRSADAAERPSLTPGGHSACRSGSAAMGAACKGKCTAPCPTFVAVRQRISAPSQVRQTFSMIGWSTSHAASNVKISAEKVFSAPRDLRIRSARTGRSSMPRAIQ